MRAAVIGAGNVATHLALGLDRAGADIVAVCSRGAENAARLADRVGAAVCTCPADIPADVDFVLIAVSDSSVSEVAARLPKTSGVVAHTSGSVPLERLSEHHARAAVLYPLQTFSRDVPVNLAEVPFFTEAADETVLESVDRVARMLSEHVYHADSPRRARLHVAGVLSSNFTVYLLEECRKVLAAAGFPLDVVRPLVEATMAKTFAVGPREAMTGPARRGDVAVVERQAGMLEGVPAEIYRLISKQIFGMYHECD